MVSSTWSPEQERGWRTYRRMQLLLDATIARDLHERSGLSEADIAVLASLSEAPGGRRRAGELAAELVWSTSRLAHHVGRMQSRDLVRRDAADNDGRGAVVVLTPAGRRAWRTAGPRYRAAIRTHFLDQLSAAELRTLTRLATRLAAELEQ